MKEHILQIGKDSFWYVMAQGVFAAIAFLSVPIFTRIFTPAQYGVYSLVVTTLGFAMPLFYIWISNAVVRYYPEYKRKEELAVFYSTIFHYTPHFMIFFLGIVLPVAAFLLPLGGYRTITCLGICVFAFSVPSYVGLSILIARQKPRWYAFFFITVAVFRYLVGALLATKAHAGVAGIFWAWLGILIVLFPIEFLVLGLHRTVRWRRYSPVLQREFLRFGFVLIFVNISFNVLNAIDRYMVQGFKGSAQVGLYSVVYTLVVDVFAIILYAVQQGASPVVFKTYEYEGRERAVTLMSKLTRYFLILMVPSTVAICVLRYRIILVIASEKYISATGVVAPLTIGLLLCNLAWLPAMSFYLEKKTTRTLIPVTIAAALNIGLNVWLIPRYGFAGAAWATFISYLLYFILMTVISLKFLPWRFPWVDLAKVTVASAVTGGALLALDRMPIGGVAGLALAVIGGTLVFLAAFFVLRGYTPAELEFARSLALRVLRPGKHGGGDDGAKPEEDNNGEKEDAGDGGGEGDS